MFADGRVMAAQRIAGAEATSADALPIYSAKQRKHRSRKSALVEAGTHASSRHLGEPLPFQVVSTLAEPDTLPSVVSPIGPDDFGHQQLQFLAAPLSLRVRATFLEELPTVTAAQRTARSCGPEVFRDGSSGNARRHREDVVWKGIVKFVENCRLKEDDYMAGLALRVQQLRDAENQSSALQSCKEMDDSKTTINTAKREDQEMDDGTTISTSSRGDEEMDDSKTISAAASSTRSSTMESTSDTVTPPQTGTITTMMFRNIPYTLTKEMLQGMVEDAGFVTQCFAVDMPRSSLGHVRFSNKGYAFVTFDAEEAATRFQSLFDGYVFPLRQNHKVCEVTPARRQRLLNAGRRVARA